MVSRQHLLFNTKTKLFKHPIFNSIKISNNSCLTDNCCLLCSNYFTEKNKTSLQNIQVLSERNVLIGPSLKFDDLCRIRGES